MGSVVQGLVIAVDLVYKWVLLDGTLQNPKRFQIIPDIKIPFTCIRLELKGCLENRKLQTGIVGLNCYVAVEAPSSQ